MKLIKPHVELIEQVYDNNLNSIWQHIEKCGRTCYKSEDKITPGGIKIGNTIYQRDEVVKREDAPGYPEDKEMPTAGLASLCSWYNFNVEFIPSSAEKFVDAMINSEHGAMLEHGTVYLTVDMYAIDVAMKYQNNPYSRVVYNEFAPGHVTEAFITTNYRVIIENNWINDIQYMCKPTEHHIKRYTFKMTCDLGVSREANRHRHNSIAEESTRYCNYSKDKFGNELSIIQPDDVDIYQVSRVYEKFNASKHDENHNHLFYNMCRSISKGLINIFESVDAWMFANLACEWSYLRLIELGWKPQQARRILPLDLKTELVHTAFEDDWKHFIDLRFYGTTGAPHPDMKIIAKQINDLIK